MTRKVLITARSVAQSAAAKAVLQAAGCELFFNPYDRPLTAAELVPLVAGMDALMAGNDEVTAAVIAAGQPCLKIIARNGVGYNKIDVAAAKKAGVAVTVTPGANNKSVADMAIGLLLAVGRGIPRMDAGVRAGSWDRVSGCELDGKTLGVVGTGSIGAEVIKRAAGFGLRIVAFDPVHRPELEAEYGVTYLPLAAVLAEADFLTLHAPATAETAGLINKASLATMKRTAFIVNTARGDLVVENDLYNALSQGRIAGAALDTFSHEPFTDERWFALKNVVFTPHAGANTAEAVTKMGVMAAEEVVRVLSGQPPLYPVA